MEPPPCVQNAMMTKDKKPFTYTPGGIDLSEVRSPRMQRRIERNANLGGAGDMPKPPQPPPQNVGPLPPSALAAMRPQTQVQVFPSPPPPPPTQKNIPPPPPPPSCPLPTQKVTANNEVLERPDMTKIIPENPMALLRKTGGPAPRKTLVEQLYEEQRPSSPPQRNYEAQAPRYQPPVVERPAPASPPTQPQRPPQAYQSPPQQYQPPSPPQNQYQPQPSYQPAPPQPQYQRPSEPPKPAYQPPVIERQPSISRPEPPAQKNVASNVGSLYIPPLNQQQQKVVAPPTPPERNQPQVQSPGTPPTLKEAPRPWQKSQQQQQEIPPWAKKDSPDANMQQRWQQQPAPAQPPQSSSRPATQQQLPPRPSPGVQPSRPSDTFPVHIEIRAGPGYYQPEPEPSEKKPNAVYVTQPIVLQHPGSKIEPPYQGPPKPQQQHQQPRPQVVQQQSKIDSTGARIIPIQIERTPPSTPGADRNLNRQMSWGSQPTQSNSFKVIQKFTKTDDEEDDTPLTQHSPRYPQEMPEQMRRMKTNENNGHFRQVPQQNGGSRTIPVQIEGNGQSQPYVHPSEQVVPEPKKYMGSNIPSRSFKILQAMTGPSENCANANNNNEDIPPYNPVFNPYSYPYFPAPYWSEYYGNFDPSSKTKTARSSPLAMPFYPPQHYWHDYHPYPQEQSDSTSKMSDQSSRKSGRSTPLSMQYPLPSQPYYPQEQSDSTSRMSDKSSTKSGRTTPLSIPPPMPPPYWGYMVPPGPYRPPKSDNTLRPKTPSVDEETYHCPPPIYPPYFDPYYYSYYYGYHPMMPPYPYQQSSVDTEDYSEYSSMDEMSNISDSRRSFLQRRNSLEGISSSSVQALRQQFEVRSKSAAPRITITPSQENVELNRPPDKVTEEADDNEDSNQGRLRSIKSVQNVHVYAQEDDTNSSDSDEDTSIEQSDEDDASDENDEKTMPDQLSVIYEESERTDSRRSFRCSSVASETTTIADHQSEEDDDDFLASQNVRYKIKLFQESSETSTVKSMGGRTVKTFEEETDSFASFTFKKGSACNSKSIKDDFSNVRRKLDIQEIKSDNESLESTPEILCIEDKKVQKEIPVDDNKKEHLWDEIRSKTDNKTVAANVDCNNVNSKAESVMVEVGDEIVCVKLRKKNGNIRSEETAESENERNIEENCIVSVTLPSKRSEVVENEQESFFSVSQRSSVYDVLKDEEHEDTLVSGGTLMRVDSFASQLEAIKRNSGLWTSLNKENNTIQEESSESEDDGHEKNNLKNDDSQDIVNENNQCQNGNLEETSNTSEESEVDFWSQIKNDDDDDFTPRRSYFLNEDNEVATPKEIRGNEEASIDSADSSDSSCSKSHKNYEENMVVEEIGNIANKNTLSRQYAQENNEESEDESNSDSSEDDKQVEETRCNKSRSRSLEPQTIKDRIEALRNSMTQKEKMVPEKEDIAVCVKSKVSAIEVPCESRSKTASTKSSLKSFEEYSEEEELDSGVISDISRHISDNEDFPELRKMTRYERAATHSRLFKLLQDECDIEDEEADNMDISSTKEDKFSKLSVRKNKGENHLCPSKSKLSLPLNKLSKCDQDPKSEVNEKLVEELVQSLLRSKKAHVFRNMHKEKLYAAAKTILQEGIDSGETPSEEFSSLLSPLRGDTQSSTPAQTPQEFYTDSEYKQYYDSWSDAAVDLVPSKAFKLLQEHLGSNKLGSLEGILAKCPRILSSKNIPKDVLKVVEECPSPSLQHFPQSNDVTNT